MQNVEGMWLMRSSEVSDISNAEAPSVIVLETQRLFGGDSAHYYVGDYRIEAGKIVGTVRTRTHTIVGDAENVFGMKGELDFTVDFTAEMIDGVISGIMHPRHSPEVAQWFHLTRLADLPG